MPEGPPKTLQSSQSRGGWRHEGLGFGDPLAMRLHGIVDLFMMAKLAEKIPMIMVYGRYMELVLGEFGRPMNDITGHHLVST